MRTNATVVANCVIREPKGAVVLPGTRGVVRHASERLGEPMWLVEWESGERCFVFARDVELAQALASRYI
jgi:hypothetical protein